ncbi:DUF2339 domain-containing protein [Flavihumibacter petaseus]|uniref:DUF2339 domain-containing protein n=1 Tax=Flavihumibacter petaseus NBRC 106054 TaxID=1220578 RepID=A0A0E9N4W4_9BACT|nr:DUF2339 domain-containing protein [Flavihumibacter petaseus]GAO44848.1 hypothetical protein FPE01S_04_00910 [Flavihumibacter petaseus NBRC 106054]
MEFLLIPLCLVMLVVLFSLKNIVRAEFKRLDNQLWQLRQEITSWKKEQVPVESKPVSVAPDSPPIAPVQPEPTTAPEPFEEPVAIPVPVEPEPTPVQRDYWKSGFEVVGETEKEEEVSAEVAFSPVQHEVQAPKPGFFDRHPDLEKFIGENLVSKIGIAILVMAIAYFVKFAIDNNWIGPVGRVAIGVLCAGVLIGIGHYLRRSYHAFSSVIVGGGIAVLYFTIALAYQQFHLFPQSIAFIIMLVITVFAVILSLLYDRQELAVIGLVGGFAAPFLVSNNSGNFRALFTYLSLLNAGLLLIAYRKNWRLLNLLAFVFTVLLFGGWLATAPATLSTKDYMAGFWFAILFHIIFFAANVAYNIRRNQSFVAADFSMILSNAALFFTAGLILLHRMQAEHLQGLFTIAMAVIYCLLSFIFFRNRKVEANIIFLLIGLTVSFISLTAPIQLKGNHITLFWATEAVLLYWVHVRSRMPLFRYTTALVWGAMMISLMIDWEAGAGLLTGLYAGITTFALFYLVRDREQRLIGYIVEIAGLLIFYISGILEIDRRIDAAAGQQSLMMYEMAYTVCFSGLLFLLRNYIRIFQVQKYLLASIIAFTLFYFFLLTSNVFHVQAEILQAGKSLVPFLWYWLAGAVVALMIAWFSRMVYNNDPLLLPLGDAAPWLLVFCSVLLLSIAGHLLVNQIFFSPTHSLSDLQRIYLKSGLPILWGGCSFVLMWQGMRKKWKTLRIISLSLFTLTLIKLFVFDIRNISVAGKIAAFFCLGVLLLVVSFMYQRLKKIIIEDEEKPSV